MMKNIRNCFVRTIIFFLGIVFSTGCTTTEKFHISTKSPSTVSYAYVKKIKEMKSIPVTPAQTSEIEIPSDMYLGYVVATDDATGLTGPIGIDVHRDKHHGTKTMAIVAYTLLPTLIGTPLYFIEGMRFQQFTCYYQFGYDKWQTIDFSGMSTTLLYPDPPKDFEGSTSSTSKKGKASGMKNSKKSGGTTPMKASKIKSKDVSSFAAGSYWGSGKLLLDNELTDLYSDIELVIEKVNKNYVDVTIKSEGEELFEEPLRYKVRKNKDGSLYLELESEPKVYIKISRSGHASFSHKYVQIDGDIYTLNIEADKM